jgi:hypothetical protein
MDGDRLRESLFVLPSADLSAMPLLPLVGWQVLVEGFSDQDPIMGKANCVFDIVR